MIEIALLRIDGETQSRVEVDQAVVQEYAEAYLAGAQFPPVTVFFDGTDRWLADGFHRYYGAVAAGEKTIYEHVIPGTLLDARLYSYGANGQHGLRRTNADKRKAVQGALAHPVSSAWSDREIAKHCGVTHPFVASLRNPKVVTVTTPDDASGSSGVVTVTTSVQAAPTGAAVQVPSKNEAPAAADTANAAITSIASAEVGPSGGEEEPVPTSGLVLAAETSKPSSPVKEAGAPDSRDLQLGELLEEVAGLRNELADVRAGVAAVVAEQDTDKRLEIAMRDAQEQRALCRGLQVRVDSLLTEVGEAKRQVAYWKRKAERAA